MALFVAWYNEEHLHSGIGYVTPAQRHRGEDVAVLAKRRSVFERAKRRNPARWSGDTQAWARPTEVRLGRPASRAAGNPQAQGGADEKGSRGPEAAA
jgi:putative transposase